MVSIGYKSNIKISIDGITGASVLSLLNAVQRNTGYKYGYIAHNMTDTTIHSFTLTLCEKKKISKKDTSMVMFFIRGWFSGSQVIVYGIQWS